MINDLNLKYGISEKIHFSEGKNKLPRATLRHSSGSEVEVYLYAAHITSWQIPRFGEVLFLSSKADFSPGKALRGGVPIIFPQFGGGSLPSHGFARNNTWMVHSSQIKENGEVQLVFSFSDTESTRAIWPNNFNLKLEVSLSDELRITLIINNTGNQAFNCQSALHTYFRVGDISKVIVPGLDGLTYLDNLKSREAFKETEKEFRFFEEVDRIYQNAPSEIKLIDNSAKRVITVKSEGFRDAVLWNPWEKKASAMNDMEEEAHRKMLCIESANTFPADELQAGASISLSQILCVNTL